MTRVAKALIYDNDGNLLVLTRSSTHPLYAFESDLPGGIVESGESFENGLAREVLEEAGLAIEETDFNFLAKEQRIGHGEHRLYVVHMADRPDVMISWEHASFEWVPPHKLDTALTSKDAFMRFVRKTLDTD